MAEISLLNLFVFFFLLPAIRISYFIQFTFSLPDDGCFKSAAHELILYHYSLMLYFIMDAQTVHGFSQRQIFAWLIQSNTY